MSITRVLIVLGAIAILYLGYKFYREKRESARQAEYIEYATVISEVSMAAEMYRNNSDSFLVVRDSILDSHGMTVQSIDSFKEKLSGNKPEWAEVWKHVVRITDSLVAEKLIESEPDKPDSIIDPTKLESILMKKK